ncbi:PREDICTED: uncharacterized protein LOC108364236 [Rhagoletis zephyria]|uniref:uncharacterized protein LOC108364236 n=1 Tax=Rhagoletis zephyria TaxID=28612 RepID=UPI0008117D72|nr:PREDICTED: uncharacterized protein LOC108364236 [Rhagoletis zephyria]XP_036340516.1 uncharacterized protein LOC118749842 [Rhagoletis pomonella]
MEKVWIDWKSTIRKKLAHNKKETTATGGGPFAQLPLTAVEEEIASFCGLYSMAEGMKGSKTFGSANAAMESSQNEENCSVPDAEEGESPPKPKRRRRTMPDDLEGLCSTQNEVLERVAENLKQLNRNIERQNEIQEEVLQILKNKFQSFFICI